MTKKPSNLQKKNRTLGAIEVARKNEETILGFYDSLGLGAAIGKSQFDLQEEMDTIISHIRDDDPKVSLAALKHFRSVLKDITSTTGMVGNMSKTQHQVGGEVTTTTSLTANTLLTNLRKENELREDLPAEDRHEIHRAFGPGEIKDDG